MFQINQYHIFGFSIVSGVSFCMYVYWNIYNNLLKQEKNMKPLLPPPPDYLQIMKDKFVQCYEKEGFNQNIQPEFYDKEQYNETIIRKDNLLDSSWKSRILFENTPQGLVIMLYDAYKQGFAYYSNNNITYPYLNAVAMKYVSQFYCRDFFIDDSIIPKEHSSPFLHIHEIDKNEKSTKQKIDVNKGPFAKLKTYNKPKPKLIEPVKTENTPTHIKNKFVYLGKIYKFSPLQKIKNENQRAEKKEPIAMNYSNFKKWHNPEKFDLVAT